MSKSKQPIRYRKAIPGNMFVCWWPSKLKISIKQAVAWFVKKFGVRPMYVVAELSDVRLTQDVVRMWHEAVFPRAEVDV